MSFFAISTFAGILGLLLFIAGGCHDRPRLVLIGLLLMVPEMGNEAGLWKITPHCSDVSVPGCTK